MPKNQVTDPITDQEMAFARLVLSGTMTDRQAAEASGLNPETAAYTKAKPRVRTYMLEHRAAVQEQLVQQEADLSRRAVEGLRRQSISREQVLDRLWEIANLSPEMTRNSITGQIKALAMIVAIEGLIPDRAQKPSASPPLKPNVHIAPQYRQQQAQAAGVQPSPDLVPDKEEPPIPDPPPAAAAATPPTLGPAFASNECDEYNFAHLSETVSAAVLDPAAAFSIKKEPYVRRYGPF